MCGINVLNKKNVNLEVINELCKKRGPDETNVENINDRSYGVWTYENDKVINGGNYYNEITGSLNKNETQSIPLQPLLGECSL